MYLVIELQKTGNQLAHIVTTFSDKNEAESKYYNVLAAAAVSSVQKHAAVIITEDGMKIKSEVYEHEQEEL